VRVTGHGWGDILVGTVGGKERRWSSAGRPMDGAPAELQVLAPADWVPGKPFDGAGLREWSLDQIAAGNDLAANALATLRAEARGGAPSHAIVQEVARRADPRLAPVLEMIVQSEGGHGWVADAARDALAAIAPHR
jgi:hypothetical protein